MLLGAVEESQVAVSFLATWQSLAGSEHCQLHWHMIAETTTPMSGLYMSYEPALLLLLFLFFIFFPGYFMAHS